MVLRENPKINTCSMKQI